MLIFGNKIFNISGLKFIFSNFSIASSLDKSVNWYIISKASLLIPSSSAFSMAYLYMSSVLGIFYILIVQLLAYGVLMQIPGA